MTDYDDIKAAVDAKLAGWGITYSARLVGETKRDDGWICDEWRAVLRSRGGAEYCAAYYTGVGLRKQIRAMPKPPYRRGTLAYEEWAKTAFKPVAPRAADVLQSLVLDSGANDMSFTDWCADYGYSDDSLKALDMYRACCDVAKDLRRIFSRAQINEIAEMTAEL